MKHAAMALMKYSIVVLQLEETSEFGQEISGRAASSDDREPLLQVTSVGRCSEFVLEDSPHEIAAW